MVKAMGFDPMIPGSTPGSPSNYEREPRGVRIPKWAGRNYPSDPQLLIRTVTRLLRENPAEISPNAKVLIVPHHSYLLCGKLYAMGYSSLENRKISRALILGPNHFSRGVQLATSPVEYWATPAGISQVDWEWLGPFLGSYQINCHGKITEQEHSLEVQLPFLQIVQPNVKIVPLQIGILPDAELKELLESLWGGPETLVIISTDLSHYLSYDEAVIKDQETSKIIENKEWEKLDSSNACGYRPLRSALSIAKDLDLQVQTHKIQNSGDFKRDIAKIVGHGIFSIG